MMAINNQCSTNLQGNMSQMNNVLPWSDFFIHVSNSMMESHIIKYVPQNMAQQNLKTQKNCHDAFTL